MLAVAVDALVAAIGLAPSPGADGGEGAYLLALAYRVALAVLGGWIVAHLAPSSPMRHAVILGSIGTVLSIAGAAAQWNLGHHWYPLALVAVSLPATLLGARLHPRRPEP